MVISHPIFLKENIFGLAKLRIAEAPARAAFGFPICGVRQEGRWGFLFNGSFLAQNLTRFQRFGSALLAKFFSGVI